MPKQKKSKGNQFAEIAEQDARAVSSEKLKVSFEYMDWETEEFFFHGLESEYYKKFFECITQIQKSVEKDIVEQTHPSLRPKSIFNKNGTKNEFPTSVVEKLANKLLPETKDIESAKARAKKITENSAFEVTVTKEKKGRIHGFILNKIFYVVWVDPAHNLYSSKYGVRKQKDYATVRSFSGDEVIRLRDELKKCHEEYDELLTEWISSDNV